VAPSSYDLGYLPTLLDFINYSYLVWSQYRYSDPPRNAGPGRYFCTACGATRRMKFSILKQPNLKQEEDGLSASPSKVQMRDPGPAMFLYECGECDARYLAVIYRSARGARLAIFPESGAGLATDHTPAAVAFYLDEAHKSQSVGANSAAVTMY
jgi:hypothetical protein